MIVKQQNIFMAKVIIISSIFFGCSTFETVETTNEETVFLNNNLVPNPSYGMQSEEIRNLLEATPIGSDISLHQGEGGEWHLRIEKIFTADNIQEEASEYFEDTTIEEVVLPKNREEVSSIESITI